MNSCVGFVIEILVQVVGQIKNDWYQSKLKYQKFVVWQLVYVLKNCSYLHIELKWNLVEK